MRLETLISYGAALLLVAIGVVVGVVAEERGDSLLAILLKAGAFIAIAICFAANGYLDGPPWELRRRTDKTD